MRQSLPDWTFAPALRANVCVRGDGCGKDLLILRRARAYTARLAPRGSGHRFGEPRIMKRLVMAMIFLALLGGGAIAYHFLWAATPGAQTGQAPRQAPPVPVVVATAERRPMPVRLDAISNV